MTRQFEVRRLDDETWRQTVERIAGRHGLQDECLHLFDRYVDHGDDEGDAAFDALYEWDCLELIDG